MKMNLVWKWLWAVLFFGLGANAWALDPGGTVNVVPLIKSGSSWDGEPIVYPSGKAEIIAITVEVAPGGETGWHDHAVPSFAMMLEGELEVFLRDGRTKRIKAGDVLVEVVNTAHNGRNPGKVPARLVVFYASAEGVQHTAKRP